MTPKNIQSRLADPNRGLGKRKCPCCGCYMISPPMIPMRGGIGGRHRHDWRTKGHIRPATYTAGHRFWIWQCHRCNIDQGALSIWEWYTILKGRDDPRHFNVEILLRRLEVDFGLKDDIHVSFESNHEVDWQQHRAASANEET